MNQLADSTADKVGALMQTMQDMPQVECPVKHYFGPGLYVREVTMPAGSVIVGKPHKTEHLCVMLKGKMHILKEDGTTVEIVAPVTFVAPPGRKVALILETVVFQNIFATDETDVEKLEHMFVENPLLEGN